jgi:hypothetical protein
MFVLAVTSPALAQYQLEPEKGYAENKPSGPAMQYSRQEMSAATSDSPADFFFYYPQLPCRLTWPSDSEGGEFAYDVVFSFPGQELTQPDNGPNSAYARDLAVHGLGASRLDVYEFTRSGERYLSQTIEFPSLSAEFVYIVDFDGDGRSEIAVSGMTGISNGGGAYVFRMTDEQQLEPIMEEVGGEPWQQLLWSFYGSMELLRTPEGKWVLQGIAPIGRNLSEYFWSYFYEWDDSLGRFTYEGPSYRTEKREQMDFFRNFQRVLQDFRANPQAFAAASPGADYKFGFRYLNKFYSLDCFLEEDGTPVDLLLGEAIDELNYYLDPSLLNTSK